VVVVEACVSCVMVPTGILFVHQLPEADSASRFWWKLRFTKERPADQHLGRKVEQTSNDSAENQPLTSSIFFGREQGVQGAD